MSVGVVTAVTSKRRGAVESVVVVELSVEVELSSSVSSSSVVVVSSLVVDAPSSLLLAHEMMVRLKREMRIMYKTLLIFFLHQ